MAHLLGRVRSVQRDGVRHRHHCRLVPHLLARQGYLTFVIFAIELKYFTVRVYALATLADDTRRATSVHEVRTSIRRQAWQYHRQQTLESDRHC